MSSGKKRCAYCGRIRADIVNPTDKIFDKDFETVLKHIVGIKDVPDVFKQITVCLECASAVVAAAHIAVKTREIFIKILKPKNKRKPSGIDTATELYGLAALFEQSDDNSTNGAATNPTPKKIVQRRKSQVAGEGAANKPKTGAKKAIESKATAAAAAVAATNTANGLASTDNKDTTDDDKVEARNDQSNFLVKLPPKIKQRRKSAKETPNKPKAASAKEANETNAKKPQVQQSLAPVAVATSPAKPAATSVSPIKRQLFNKFADDDDEDEAAKQQNSSILKVPTTSTFVVSPAKLAAATTSPIKRITKFADNDDDDNDNDDDNNVGKSSASPMHSTAKKARKESGGNFSQDYSQNDEDEDGGGVKRVCKNCSKVYYCEERYLAHVDSKKCAKAAHECQHCGRRFKKLKKLHQHIRSKHDKTSSGDDDDGDS